MSYSVRVRGQVFPSARACADHFGVSIGTVYSQINRGRADFIALGKGGKRPRNNRERAISIGPLRFASLSEASVALGYYPKHISNVLGLPPEQRARRWQRILAAAMRLSAQQALAEQRRRQATTAATNHAAQRDIAA